MLEAILNQIEPPETLLIADGLDSAVIGIDTHSMRLVYSISKVIDVLMSDGMDAEEAREYFYFNINDAYVGEHTPIWCDDVY